LRFFEAVGIESGPGRTIGAERTTLRQQGSRTMSKTPRILHTLPMLAALALGACAQEDDGPDPLIGSWESRDSVAGERNELQIDPDLRGDATIWFFFEGDLYYADFDVSARVLEEGSRYELEMQCEGCSDFDFDMDCDLVYDDRLECDGDGPWADYVFEWERD